MKRKFFEEPEITIIAFEVKSEVLYIDDSELGDLRDDELPIG